MALGEEYRFSSDGVTRGNEVGRGCSHVGSTTSRASRIPGIEEHCGKESCPIECEEVRVSRSMGRWGSSGSSIVVVPVVGLVGADCDGTRVQMPRDEELREEGALDDCRPYLVVVDFTVSHIASNALFTDAFGHLSTWGYFASFSALLVPRCSAST
ncbi:unnamed protein product [Hymenolepis diminuta]|uniref:Uncharacterized protein n=1 Tax=Hymenolepis diminuta TaxID=6216 RepID=A0A0R3SNP2_HYMDI|nr:unnamed protein product [Hymenolepis diminuta]